MTLKGERLISTDKLNNISKIMELLRHISMYYYIEKLR